MEEIFSSFGSKGGMKVHRVVQYIFSSGFSNKILEKHLTVASQK